MKFIELKKQEMEQIYNAKNHNVIFSFAIAFYFVVLVVLMNINGKVNMLDTFLNLLIALASVSISYVVKERNIKTTITSKVYKRLSEEHPELQIDSTEHYESIQVKVLKGVGYIFIYKNSKLIYTSLDRKIRKYEEE